MLDEHGWRLSARCTELSPEKSDALFFPSTGGKPHKAKEYCKGCPFRRECLTDAIVNKLSGFFVGTTEDERRDMAFVQHIKVTGLNMPPEPDRDKRVIYLKVFTPPDAHNWLDEDLEPSEEELQKIAV